VLVKSDENKKHIFKIEKLKRKMDKSTPVVWITGASSGIGAELARQYSKRNINLILSARRAAVLLEVKESCMGHSKIQILPFDIIDFDSAPNQVEKALSFFGRVDVLINNAGISQRSLILDSKFEVFKKIIEIDYLGTVALSRAILPHFISQQSGHYVVVSSVMGKFGSPYRSGYCGAKHALHGFFDVMRMEHQKDNVYVTMVCPGFVATPIALNSIQGDGTALGKDDEATRKGLDVVYFVRKMIHAIDQKKWELSIGGKEKLGVFLKRLSNKLVHNVVIRSRVR
jgi:dehydrogenase/reductase SDR family member 7